MATKSCKLFQDNLPLIRRDMGVSLRQSLDPAWVDEQWEDCGYGRILTNGPHHNFGRFGAWYDCELYHRPLWTKKKTACLIGGAHTGFVNAKTEKKVLKVSDVLPVPGSGGAETSTSGTRAAAKKAVLAPVRNAAVNGLHMIT